MMSFGAWARNRREEAIRLIDRAARIYETDAESWYLLAWFLAVPDQATSADGARAVECANRALALLPRGSDENRAPYTAALAWGLHRTGRKEEAVAAIKEAIRLSPDETHKKQYQSGLEIMER